MNQRFSMTVGNIAHSLRLLCVLVKGKVLLVIGQESIMLLPLIDGSQKITKKNNSFMYDAKHWVELE